MNIQVDFNKMLCPAKQIINGISILEFIEKYALTGYQLVNVQIGYDNAVYFLLSGEIPKRIDGMFVNTIANTDYKALCLYVNWLDGTIINEKLYNLGIHEMNFHFIQPIGDDILLLGARCLISSDGVAQKNVVIVDKMGKVIREFCVGDGIQDCIVTSEEQIITSYFDEGVFGNYGWGGKYTPIGECGLIKWNSQGDILWKNENYDIFDCYAMNLDNNENLWFYYYDEFELVKTDFKHDIAYNIDIEGSSAFVFMEYGKYMLIDGGYDNHMKYKLAEISKDKIKLLSDVDINCDKEAKQVMLYAARGTKAIFHENGNFYMKEF